MNYYIARNGQTYGPYTEETVRKYVSEGSMSTTDLGCTDAAPSWIPLGQLLPAAPVPQQASAAAAPAYTPPSYTPPSSSSSPPYTPPVASAAPPYTPPAYNQPTYNQPNYSQPTYNQPPQMMGQAGPAGNIPPSLHWGLILLIAAFTGGLFITIWVFIQANWIKTIDPASKAIRDLVIGIFLPLIGVGVMIAMIVAGGLAAAGMDRSGTLGAAAIGSMVVAGLIVCTMSIIGFVFHIKAFFGMRDSMQRYYNSTENINLRLSAPMTFFFNTLYLQYHMSRIADWKRTGFLRP